MFPAEVRVGGRDVGVRVVVPGWSEGAGGRVFDYVEGGHSCLAVKGGWSLEDWIEESSGG